MKSKFAEKLSSLRREAGHSQRQVASDLGISQALLSHYENGAREPKLEFVIRACGYYGVTADYILGRTSDRGGESARLAGTVSEIVGKLEELKLAEAELIEVLRQAVTTQTGEN
jgi:transcriptional regulator with XRE-family HTH domain